MKRLLLIFIITYFVSLMTACTANKPSPIIIKDVDATSGIAQSEIIEDDDIMFEIQQTLLAKGFQNLDPKVEILKKDDGFRISASLGLFETSGVNITNINKSGDEINIHVENISDNHKNQLAIPQVIIELKNVNLKSIENLKLNIINENYTPLKVKLTANEVINKVNSDFQIVTNTSPDINILKDDENLLWEINYKNILDKYTLETPIINMSVIVDANSGELVKSSKNFISTLIDEGSILDYIPNESLLYMKNERTLLNQGKWISIWKYDISQDTSEVLYSTNSDIISAQFSPSNDSVSILESNNSSNQLYILSKSDHKAYKVMLDNSIDPSIIRWKDNNNLYILSKSDIASTIYNYTIDESTTEVVKSMYLDIVGMRIHGDDVLITVKDRDTDEYSIQMASNWDNFKTIEKGRFPRFLSEKYIGHLRFNEKNNTNELVILNKDTHKKHSIIDLNIINYFKINDNTVGIISTNSNNNNFTFHKYDIKKKKLKSIVDLTSDKAYYNSENELLYIDLKVPFESTKPQIIYSLDLNKIDTIEP